MKGWEVNKLTDTKRPFAACTLWKFGNLDLTGRLASFQAAVGIGNENES
jgi:hypothetical protein